MFSYSVSGDIQVRPQRTQPQLIVRTTSWTTLNYINGLTVTKGGHFLLIEFRVLGLVGRRRPVPQSVNRCTLNDK